jgi:hypothetical protein
MKKVYLSSIEVLLRKIIKSKSVAFLFIILFGLATANSYGQTTNTYTGSTTWTCPAGVTSITVQCWGGGGAGGSARANNSANAYALGGGGAGGAYVTSIVSVTAGTVYTITVGAAVTGTSSTTDNTVVNGNPSWFGSASTVFAQGGAGGVSRYVTTNAAFSGAGGVGSIATSIGTTKFAGGSGGTPPASSSSVPGGGGGGSAGTAANGNAGTAGGVAGAAVAGGGAGGAGSNNANGSTGASPGGGGGGARSSSTSQFIGGTGAAGQVKITYTQLTYKSTFTAMDLSGGGSSPLSWCAGETRNVKVTVTNSGTATWTVSNPIINIGVKWNTNGSDWMDYYVRVSSGGLAPGASMTYTLPITASSDISGAGYSTPLAAGTNNLTFDVVYEGISWFGDNNGGVGPGNSKYVSPAITINAVPTSVAGTAVLTCSNSGAVNITSGSSATNYSSVAWTSSGTGTFASANSLTAATYTPSVADISAGSVTLTLTANGNGTCGAVTSTKTLSIVTAPVTPGAGSNSRCGTGTVTITAIPASGETIDWYSLASGGTLLLSGNTSYTTPSISATTTYYAQARNTTTGCISSARVAVTATVNTIPAVTIANTATICSGASPNINLTASIPSTFTWTIGTITGGITGASTGSGSIINQTLTDPDNSVPGTVQYIVTPTSSSTGSCVGAAYTITVTVNAVAALITQPAASQSVCSGTSVSFTVGGAGTGITYQWYKGATLLNNGGTISGATSATLTINPVAISDAAANYYCIVSGPCSSTATSSNSALLVTQAVIITSQPAASQAICLGNPVSFSVTANAAAISYQWYKGTVALTDGGTISGSATSTLSISSVALSDSGYNYNCVITGTSPCGPVTSNNSNLTVNQYVFITAQPIVTQTVCASTSVNISVTATGAILFYQWYKGASPMSNGGNISGANSATLTINPVTVGDTSSYYYVVINGSCGFATSNSSQLLVNVLPVASISYSGTPYCSNSGVASVTQTGQGGGTYSSTAGLSINSSTGDINLAASTAGTYTVTYSFTDGTCPTTTTTSVTITALPTATISYSGSPYCSTGSTATVTRTGYTGGTYTSSPAGLSLNSGTGAVTISTSLPGTYTVTYTITAAAGCSVVTATTSITITALPTATIAYTGSPYCFNSGVATVIQTGNTGGIYSSTAGLVINSATGDVNLGTSTPNTYTVTYTIAPAGGCAVVSATASITIIPLPTVTTASTKATCSGTGSNISLTASAPSTFNWTIGTITGSITGASNGSGSTINQVLTNPSNTTAGTVQYIVTPTSNTGSCAGTPYTITVTVNPLPVVTNASTLSICNASATGIGLTASISSNFTWTLGPITGGITGASAGSGSTINQTLTNPSNSTAGAVQYIVTPTATSTGLCTGPAYTITVTVNPKPAVTNAATATTCSGTSPNINLTASTPSTFTWTVSAGTGTVTGASAGSGSTINQTLTNISNTTAATIKYNVTPTSTTGSCPGAAFTMTVTVNPQPMVTNSATATTCSGTSPNISLTSSTPSSFSWTVGTITGGIIGASNGSGSTINQTLANPSNTASGTVQYILTPVSTAGGCTGNHYTITVTVNPVPAVTISANYCYGGGYVQLTSSVGSSYLWSTGATTQSILVRLAGTYIVTVTNSFGCTGTSFINVAQELTTNGNFSAGNTGFTSSYIYTNQTYTGGTTGLWNEGLYTVAANANLYHPDFFGVDHTTGTGNFMIINGSKAAVAPTVWQETISSLTPNTTYYFSAWAMSMNNAGNYAMLQFNIAGSQVGTIDTLTAGATSTAGPFVWTQFYGSWNSGAATSAVISITDLQTAAGGNDFGLDDISFGTLSPVTFAAAPNANNGVPICVGNTMNLAANLQGGSSPFTYSWTGPNSFTSNLQNPTITNVTIANSGTYTISVTDGYGCPITANTNITINPLPVVSDQTPTSCSGTAFSVTPSVGNTYTWSAPTGSGFTGGSAQATGQASISQTLTNATTSPVTATYTVTPTSASGCTGNNFMVTVTINPKPAITSTSSATICSGGTVSIPLTSNVPSTYTWIAANNGNTTGESTTTQSTSTLSNTITNNTATSQNVIYTVTPTSTPAGCVGTSQTVTVTVSPVPIVTNKTATICSGGAFIVTPAGVPAGTTYTWAAPTGSGFTGGSAQATGQSSISQTLTNTTTSPSTAVYTVTPTSGSCPGSTFTVTVTINPIPIMTSASSAAICSGSTVSISLTSDVASTYTWKAASNPNVTGESTTTQATSTLSNTLTNTAAGNQTVIYTVTPTAISGGCIGNVQTVTVTVDALPVNKSVSPGTITICYGTSTNITINNTDVGINYQLRNNATNAVIGTAAGTGNSLTISTGILTSTTTFNVLAVNATTGCSAQMAITPVVTVAVLAVDKTPTAQASPICSGSSTNIQIASSQSGVSYQLRNNATNANVGSAVAGTGGTINLPTGTLSSTTTFNVLATTGTPCSVQMVNTVTVTVNPLPTNITPVAQTATLCSGTSTNIQLAASQSGINYQLRNNTGNVNVGSAVAGNGSTINLPTGNLSSTIVFNVLATDATTGCNVQMTPTVTVTINALPADKTVAAAASPVCYGTGTNITVAFSVSGISYQLRNNAGNALIGSAVNGTGGLINLPTGNLTSTTVFNVLATNTTTGCSLQMSITPTVTVNPLPVDITPTAQAAAICSSTTDNIIITPSQSGVNYQLRNNAGNVNVGSVVAGNGGSISFPTGVLTSTTTYNVLATNATTGCNVQMINTVTITVSPVLAGNTVGASQTICYNSAPSSLSGSSLTGGNGTYTYLWESSTTSASTGFSTVSGTSNGQNYTPGILTQPTWYRRTVTSGGCSDISSTVLISINAPGTWLGVNTNWFDNQNWCGGVPTITTDVLIPGGLSNYPYLTSGIGTVRDITINAGASVTLNPATLKISGNITNSGSFDATSGSIELNGSSPQTVAGSMFIAHTVNNLTISNTSSGVNISATANDTFKISGVLSFGNVSNAQLTTNDNLTLLSTASNTARVADATNGGINPGNTISGKVNIERYVQSHRAWRLLTAPISSAQTINSAWQEGMNNTATSGSGQHYATGYGTEITNTIATSPSATGFDQAVTNNPSILYLNAAGNGWAVPANTNTVNVNSQPGFMLFVRGDRSVVVTPPPFNPSTYTILRTKGSLNQGDQTITPAGTGFRVVGNPYASETNLNNIFNNYSSTVGANYYVWDPMTTGSLGVGSFITVTNDGVGTNTYHSTSCLSPYVLGTLESGAAFVFNFANTTPFIIHETDKAASSALVFRPVSNSDIQSFRADLYTLNPDNTSSLEDGTLTLYNNQYSNSVNWLEDAKKLSNISENLSLLRDGQSIAIEKRQPLTEADTIFLSVARMKQQAYQFVFAADGLTQSGLTATLEDSYTGASTPVSLTDTAKVGFNVTADAASQGGSRFRIVFKPLSIVPVTFTQVRASQQNKDIAVQWNVANEINIKSYEVEKSTDGVTFSEAGTVEATGGSAVEYNWLDVHAVTGFNYYRIRSIGSNGAIQYSEIVKVKIGMPEPLITIAPNPIVNGIINLQFSNMPAGDYNLRLLNLAGQEVLKQQVNIGTASDTKKIMLSKAFAKGVYQLQIVAPDNSGQALKVLNY